MLQEQRPVLVMQKTLGKTRERIRIKIARLGLEVVGSNFSPTTTIQLVLPKELPSVDQLLRFELEEVNS